MSLRNERVLTSLNKKSRSLHFLKSFERVVAATSDDPSDGPKPITEIARRQMNSHV